METLILVVLAVLLLVGAGFYVVTRYYGQAPGPGEAWVLTGAGKKPKVVINSRALQGPGQQKVSVDLLTPA